MINQNRRMFELMAQAAIDRKVRVYRQRQESLKTLAFEKALRDSLIAKGVIKPVNVTVSK